MTAHGFVTTAVDEIHNKKIHEDDELISSLQGDVKIIGSSLRFVDEFLRSILDVHATEANRLALQITPTDLLKDVLEPVCSILYMRDGSVDISVDCPENMFINTDKIRLKQVS